MSGKGFSITRLLLGLAFYLALLRSTGMGVFYPSDELALGQINYTPLALMTYAAFGVIVLYYFFSNNYRMILDFLSYTIVGVIVATCIISIAVSMDTITSFKFAFAVTAVTLPVLTYFNVNGLQRGLHRVALFMVIVCIVNLIYTLAFPGHGMMSGKHAGAWRGMFEHKNTSGPFFVVSFFFLFDQLRRRVFPTPILPVLGMCISFVFVVLSQSSTAILGLAITGFSYFFLLFLFRLRRRAERFSFFLGLISCIALLVTFGGGMLNELMYELTGKDASFSGRTNLWGPLYEMSMERPLTGYGLGIAVQPEFIAQIHGKIEFEAKSSHNSYLDLALSIGYPGTIIFFLLYFRIVTLALLHPAQNRQVVYCYALMLSIVIFYSMVGFTSSGVFIERSQFWVLLFIAMLSIGKLSTEASEVRMTKHHPKRKRISG